MKSKISLFSKAVFKRNLAGCFGVWAVLVLVYLFMPLGLHGILGEQAVYGVSMGEQADSMMQIIWTMGMFVPLFAGSALVSAMFVFSYLFTARNSNMMHTFPVNRLQLFCTNFVSGYLFLLVPQIIGAALTLLVGALHGVTNAEVIRHYLSWIVVAAGEDFFFFSFAVCVLMFVGNIIAVPILYLILNFLYAGCCMIASAMLTSVCFGIESVNMPDRFSVLTPIVYMARNIGGYRKGSGWETQGFKALAGYAVVAILFVAIALAAYGKKHIETAGDVITVNWLKPIFRWGVAICTSALGALFYSGITYDYSISTIVASAAVVGVVAFFVAQIVIERSFRVFTRKRIQECAVYTVCACALYIGLDADVLGLEKKIPAQDEVEGIQIICGERHMLAESDSDIDWARGIHAQILDSKQELERAKKYDYDMLYYTSIDYRLKDGSVLRRTYSIPEDYAPESILSNFAAKADQPETILKQYFGIHYPDISVYGGTVELYTDTDKNRRVSEADAKKLYKAIIKDVEEGHFDAFSETPDAEGTYADWGYLHLEIRDESGYVNPSHYPYGAREPERDGVAEISLSSAYTNLSATLHKLGYVSDKTYKEMGSGAGGDF